MQRKIKAVVTKFTSHQDAEAADEAYWSSISAEDRLNEWSRLYNMYCNIYCTLKEITKQRHIKKVVTKTKLHAF